MNKILPFKAVRAAEDKVGLFVTRNYQSYDKRTFKDKISNNPYSFLNIISKSNNTKNFSKIRKQFEKFIDKQILIKDKNDLFIYIKFLKMIKNQSVLYLYSQHLT